MSKYNAAQVKAILDILNQPFEASVQSAQSGAPNEISSLVLDLSTARERGDALKISFPFSSIFVEDATDLNTYVRIIPNSRDSNQEDVLLKKRDSYNFDRGVREAYLYWPAQSGKTIVIKFFVNSKFNNGSLIIDQTSTPARVDLGHGSGDLDGFTKQLFWSWGYTTGMRAMQDIHDPQGNTGALTNSNHVYAANSLYKIPNGFYAEVIGCTINVDEEIDVVNEMRLAAVDDSTSFTDDDAATTNNLGFVTNSGAANDPVEGSYDVRIINDSTSTMKGYLRRGLIIEAGEIPLIVNPLAFTNNATTGFYTGFLLIRLKPVVGE